jgi:hypothetical protein
LLIWDRPWPQNCIAKVLSDLTFKTLTSKSIFTSSVRGKTILHLTFDEDEAGFKINYFA